MIFLKKFIYFRILNILQSLLYISIYYFFKKNNFLLKKKIYVPDQNTYGDSLLYYDFIRLKNLKKKKNFFILIPNIEQQKLLSRIFLMRE